MIFSLPLLYNGSGHVFLNFCKMGTHIGASTKDNSANGDRMVLDTAGPNSLETGSLGRKGAYGRGSGRERSVRDSMGVWYSFYLLEEGPSSVKVAGGRVIWWVWGVTDRTEVSWVI